ncbi:MAG: ribosome assembly cofactor RimP [Treponema sp.]|jgi:ribosome maturation factor RimP|nr:ribosome assembly cofactor RimP [Treponema sp.]
MRYTPPAPDPVTDTLEPIARFLKLSLVETTVSRHKGSVQVRIVVYKEGDVSHNDCSAFHRSALPRLELAFPGQDLYVEVSSPGIDRLIKDGGEFRHYLGRRIRCYRIDMSDWFSGVLIASDEKGIRLEKEGEEYPLSYDIIAKARLEDL